MLPLRDRALVQIVDDALADATARGGAWLACRPGCTPCCHGVFRISQLDAARLRAALASLAAQEPERAEAIVARARQAVSALSLLFPGDAATGVLAALPEAEQDWDLFADLPQADGPCPVLDPATGRCELYSGRPLTCRIFGPPVQNEAGIGMCELCYQGASEEQILAGEMHLRHGALEAELDRELAAELDLKPDREPDLKPDREPDLKPDRELGRVPAGPQSGAGNTGGPAGPPSEATLSKCVLPEAGPGECVPGETVIAWALVAPAAGEG